MWVFDWQDEYETSEYSNEYEEQAQYYNEYVEQVYEAMNMKSKHNIAMSM